MHMCIYSFIYIYTLIKLLPSSSIIAKLMPVLQHQVIINLFQAMVLLCPKNPVPDSWYFSWFGKSYKHRPVLMTSRDMGRFVETHSLTKATASN